MILCDISIAFHHYSNIKYSLELFTQNNFNHQVFGSSFTQRLAYPFHTDTCRGLGTQGVTTQGPCHVSAIGLMVKYAAHIGLSVEFLSGTLVVLPVERSYVMLFLGVILIADDLWQHVWFDGIG